jgi:hypothetical protein
MRARPGRKNRQQATGNRIVLSRYSQACSLQPVA